MAEPVRRSSERRTARGLAIAEPVRRSSERRTARGLAIAEPVRRSSERRTAQVLTVLLVGATALAADAAPRGRVVRVERNTIRAVPRFCLLGGHHRAEGTCFGDPHQGETIELVDPAAKALGGEFVIDSVTEAAELAAIGLCASAGVHTVKGTYASGTDDGGRVWGLRGLRLNPRVARVMSTDLPAPSGRADESVELAIDADGDGRADLMLTQYACDSGGAPAGASDARCYDTYLEQHDGMRRVQQDILRSCR